MYLFIEINCRPKGCFFQVLKLASSHSPGVNLTDTVNVASPYEKLNNKLCMKNVV